MSLRSTVEPAADSLVDQVALHRVDLDRVDLDQVDLNKADVDRADLDDDYYQSRPPGPASGDNPDYVKWLVEESMLGAAKASAAQFIGQGSMWQNPYAEPNPRAAITKAANWLTLYPISMITRPGSSFLGTLGDSNLWDALQQIGITAVHTGPVKRAGGITGWKATPSIDGHFDRISTRFDNQFGTEDEFRTMCTIAARHGGAVIDDIVPGHTGKGADFRLAEMKVGDYPGVYHMIEIPRADWHLLPDIPSGRDSVNLDQDTERRLADAGHIIGAMQRVIFNEPGVKDTNWSATAPVLGPDGTEHRWVYLHYFKEGQPSLNWLDPTFAGMRLVIGDALHSLSDLGSTALRLDANGFLGVEKSVDGPAWSEGHPLSEAANQLIGSMVRKVGGFTFQELNLSIDDIKNTSERGADLSYDFVNRPAYHHALATGDAEFLRLTMNEARAIGVDTASLVHALQNHDELTYELIHFDTVHSADTYIFRNRPITGGQLAALVRRELIDTLTGDRAPYNAIFTTNGISSTTATVIAASLGLHDLGSLDPAQIETITRAHLLLAMYNAWQPGVFALSGWDLVGALTLDPRQVADLTRDGDTRWIHRCAYDLMDYRPEATDIDRRHAQRPGALRTTACPAEQPELLRPTAERHSRGPSPPRHRHRHPAGHRRRIQPGDAGHGPRPRRGSPGDRPQLLVHNGYRGSRVRPPDGRQHRHRHAHQRATAGRG